MSDIGEEIRYIARGNFKAGVSILIAVLDICIDRL